MNLIEAPSLAGSRAEGPPPVMEGLADAGDTPLDLRIQDEAEKRREGAALQTLVWEGKTLKPWSLMRHALHRRFIQTLSPIPVENWGADIDAHGPDVMLFLWLASHSEEHILSLIGNPMALWLVVFAWGEQNLPRAKWEAAMTLMLQTFDLGRLTEVKVTEEAGKSVGKP